MTTPDTKQTSKCKGIIKLCRPRHWVKNSFIIAPLIFTLGDASLVTLVSLTIALVSFCATCSCIYALNDCLDVENDRLHPTKRFERPIASSLISRNLGFRVSLLLGAIGLAVSLCVNSSVFFLVALYISINLAYSIILKNVPYIELMCIVSGFVIRILIGASALMVPVTMWIILTTVMISLFLISMKRRQEMINTDRSARGVLKHYHIKEMTLIALASCAGTVATYLLYLMQTKIDASGIVALTVLVSIGLIRYWKITQENPDESSPVSLITKDTTLIAIVIAWLLISLIA
ncbi:putative Decaprenyl-phosphate phosphoribosyltransferase [Vibrio chagasii]|nr:putative Decaprenyl-phosphate phosphoribosyltransferase [Vibrio chagasii]